MPRITVVWKINLLVLGGLILLLGSSVLFGIYQSTAQGESRVRLALTAAGVSASLVLDTAEIPSLVPEDASKQPYLDQEASLKRLAEAFGLSDLYVVRPGSESGSWEFVFDTADGPFDEESGASGGFSAYDSPPPELEAAWTGREAVVTAEPYTDEYGTFRSAFLPLLDSSGIPVALVGADFNLAQLIQARNEQILLFLALAVAGLLLMALLAWALVRMIDVPLTMVSRRFSALVEGSADFSERLELRRRDELGDLADGFNAFVDKLRVLVADLRTGVEETGKIQVLLQRDSEETSISLTQTRQAILSLTASGSILDHSIGEVLTSLEAMTGQGQTLEALARSQESSTEQAALDHDTLDQEASSLRDQSHAVSRALVDLDRESSENARRMEGELSLLRQLEGAVQAVNGIVATLVNTADSTALLAMNASIEAAHAGLQGRGFAVIAQRMRQQAETSRADADRIGATLQGMVDLIGEAALAAQETAKGAEATHARIESAKALVADLTRSGDNLEAYSRRNRTLIESLRQASRGVATASAAVSSGTLEITDSTRSLREVSEAVLGGVETIVDGTNHVSAVFEDIREVANRLTVVSQSLSENLLRIQTR